jgi:hypothetical protein
MAPTFTPQSIPSNLFQGFRTHVVGLYFTAEIQLIGNCHYYYYYYYYYTLITTTETSLPAQSSSDIK